MHQGTRVRAPGLALLFAGLLACTLLPVPADARVPVAEDRQRIPLDTYLLAHEDDNGTARAANLLDDPDNVRWRGIRRGHFNAGHTRSVWWLRMELRNTDPVPRERVLLAWEPSLDDIRMYSRCGDAAPTQARSGDLLPFTMRALPDRNPAFLVTLPPRSECRLLLRLESHQQLRFPAELLDLTTYTALRIGDTGLRAVLLGMLALLAMAGTALAAATRRQDALLLSAVTWCEVGLCLARTGFGYEFLWPALPHLQNVAEPVLIAASWSMVSMFSLEVLGIHARLPRLFFSASWLLAGGAALLAAVQPDARYTQLLVLVVCLGILGLISVSLHGWFSGVAQARTLAAGILLVSVAALHEAAVALGVVEMGPRQMLGLQAMFVVQTILFAWALWQRASHDLPSLHEAQIDNEIRRRVAERTRELSSNVARLNVRNQQLDRLSTTDALTGTWNRRFMDRCLAQVREQGMEAPLSFILFDIDHFKQVNDRWGHHEGDRCLRAVVQCVRAQLREPNDVLCRYGGEEFAIVLPFTDLNGARRVAEKVRCAVAAMPIALGNGEELHVTISLGIATTRADGDILQMVQRADQALYAAKRQGRNRWQDESAA
jgi:diguanylate cyclase (GGDEF)-like protein